MDDQTQKLKKLSFVSTLLLASLLTGCGEKNKYESLLPQKTETCDGNAIPSRYIVHFKNGNWDFIENFDRENFKQNYVRKNFHEIDFIEYDQKISIQSDNNIVQPFRGIDNWGIANINAPAAWQKNYLGQEIVIAVVDSGVDIEHSKLTHQIAYNPGESGSLKNNGIDDDGNGYIDDYAGYNFYDDNGDVSDPHSGHGTHISGIIAGEHSDTLHNTGHIQGVAPKAKILPVKFLGQGGGTLSAALQGIDYAVSRGATIINASWGGDGCSTSLRQKVSELSIQNVLFVAAAGNSGNNIDTKPEFPAAFNLPHMLTIGYIRSNLAMDAFSNYSENLVHLFAPGAEIVSTYPGESYISFSGTSMATPFVSGAAAVLQSANPNLNFQDIRKLILNSVDTNSSYVNMTRGRLNLGKAIENL